MKSSVTSIVVFVLLMFIGAWLLLAREQRIATYEYGETVPPGSERQVVLRSTLGPIFARDADYVYCVGDEDSYLKDEPFQERVLSEEPDYFGVSYIEQRPGSDLYDGYYSFDRTSVYYNCQKIEGVDPDNFVLFEYNFGGASAEPKVYVFAGNNIYYKDRLYMQADSETLELQPDLRTAIENTVLAPE